MMTIQSIISKVMVKYGTGSNFNNITNVLGIICRANSCSSICDTNYLMYISSPFNYRERRKMTQLEAIKNHLEKHPNGLTSLEAIELYGATRLSGAIYKLKHIYRMNIITEYEKVQTRYGVSVIARYKLKEEK